MIHIPSIMLLSLSFAFALVASRALAAPYIVTNYIKVSVYTEDEGFTYLRTTVAPSLYTYTQAVVPATPVSAITTITVSAEYAEVTVLDIVVASGSAKSYTDDTYDSTYLETQYVVPITYVPNATCTGQNWTYSTNVPIYVPPIVSFSPVTVSTSATTYSYLHYNPTPTTEIIAVLNPTDVSAEDLASASLENEPYGLSYCYSPTSYCEVATATAAAAQCTTTFVYDSSEESGNGNNFSSDGSFDDGYGDTWVRDIILICVLVPVGWWLIWLCIGLFESWLSFKGLMLGQHRKRGLPYSWCCISILFLCFTGPTYKAKSVEEQARLAEQWKEMKAGRKFKLWMKWGFRWKYPVEVLGDEPELAKRALRQGCL